MYRLYKLVYTSFTDRRTKQVVSRVHRTYWNNTANKWGTIHNATKFPDELSLGWAIETIETQYPSDRYKVDEIDVCCQET